MIVCQLSSAFRERSGTRSAGFAIGHCRLANRYAEIRIARTIDKKQDTLSAIVDSHMETGFSVVSNVDAALGCGSDRGAGCQT